MNATEHCVSSPPTVLVPLTDNVLTLLGVIGTAKPAPVNSSAAPEAIAVPAQVALPNTSTVDSAGAMPKSKGEASGLGLSGVDPRMAGRSGPSSSSSVRGLTRAGSWTLSGPAQVRPKASVASSVASATRSTLKSVLWTPGANCSVAVPPTRSEPISAVSPLTA